MSIDAIRERLRARLATVPGLHAHASLVSSPQPPAACVVPARMGRDRDSDGGSRLAFDVWLYVAAVDPARGQQEIEALMAQASAALGAEPGAVVRSGTPARLLNMAGGRGLQLLTASLQVQMQG